MAAIPMTTSCDPSTSAQKFDRVWARRGDMSDVLDRIRAKITRAQQHLEGFRLRLDAFYASKPYTVDIKEDPAVGKRVYYVTKADPVPLDLETIAADVIQNLRSPLDQIAYQLVLAARGGVAP